MTTSFPFVVLHSMHIAERSTMTRRRLHRASSFATVTLVGALSTAWVSAATGGDEASPSALGVRTAATSEVGAAACPDVNSLEFFARGFDPCKSSLWLQTSTGGVVSCDEGFRETVVDTNTENPAEVMWYNPAFNWQKNSYDHTLRFDQEAAGGVFDLVDQQRRTYAQLVSNPTCSDSPGSAMSSSGALTSLMDGLRFAESKGSLRNWDANGTSCLPSQYAVTTTREIGQTGIEVCIRDPRRPFKDDCLSFDDDDDDHDGGVEVAEAEGVGEGKGKGKGKGKGRQEEKEDESRWKRHDGGNDKDNDGPRPGPPPVDPVIMKFPPTADFETAVGALPTNISSVDDERLYSEFFDRFGTELVTRVALGWDQLEFQLYTCSESAGTSDPVCDQDLSTDFWGPSLSFGVAPPTDFGAINNCSSSSAWSADDSGSRCRPTSYEKTLQYGGDRGYIHLWKILPPEAPRHFFGDVDDVVFLQNIPAQQRKRCSDSLAQLAEELVADGCKYVPGPSPPPAPHGHPGFNVAPAFTTGIGVGVGLLVLLVAWSVYQANYGKVGRTLVGSCARGGATRWSGGGGGGGGG